MTLARNLLLFFLLFLPLTCATGLATDAFVGPVPPTRLGYEVQVFMTAVMPLLVPTFLAVPLLHFGFRFWLRATGPTTARWVAVATVPIGLLAVHVAVFGLAFASAHLLILFVVAGAIYGRAFGLVRAEA